MYLVEYRDLPNHPGSSWWVEGRYSERRYAELVASFYARQGLRTRVSFTTKPSAKK